MALTNDDIGKITEHVGAVVEEKIEEKQLLTKKDISYLPTKDDFYNKMDEVMGELKAIREETQVLSGLHEKVNDHEERFEIIENKLQIPNVS
jgi:hypothetical protein